MKYMTSKKRFDAGNFYSCSYTRSEQSIYYILITYVAISPPYHVITVWNRIRKNLRGENHRYRGARKRIPPLPEVDWIQKRIEHP